MSRPISLLLAFVASVSINGCYSDVTRNVRRQFASDYDCRDFTVSDRQGVMGAGYYVARGCGRTVEYTCQTEDRAGYAGPGIGAPHQRNTFCSARVLSSGNMITAASQRPRDARAHAERITDAQHGVTYVGLTLSQSWWEIRFIAPEQDGRLTGEVVVVLRAATASSLLQRCAELVITTGTESTRLVSSGGAGDGRVIQYRTTIAALRAIAMSDRIRFEGCNVTHDLGEAERSDLRQFVLLATPAP